MNKLLLVVLMLCGCECPKSKWICPTESADARATWAQQCVKNINFPNAHDMERCVAASKEIFCRLDK